MNGDPRLTAHYGDDLCLSCFQRPQDPRDSLHRCTDCVTDDGSGYGHQVGIFEQPSYLNRTGERVIFGRVVRHRGAE